MVANTPGGFNLGDAYGRVILDASSVDQAIGQAQRVVKGGLDNMAGMLTSWGGQLARAGVSLGLMVAPLAAIGKQGLATAADFDVLMKQIEVFGGVVPDQMERVREFALKMGADTKFSAGEAAAAMLELLKSGQSLEQAMSTLPTVLNLAAAGELGLAEAAGIVSTGLATFKLSAEDSARVADALARSANASRADVRDLGLALSDAGGVASSAGLSIEETAAILGVFSNAGITGAEAGNQLRSMLREMRADTKPTIAAWKELGISMYDANGQARPLNDVLKELKVQLDKLPDKERNRLIQTLAGSFGVVGLEALMASNGIDSMMAAMAAAPSAQKVAEEFMNTFKGVSEELGGSIETLMINVFTPYMNDVLVPMIKHYTEIVNKINDWAKANPRLTKLIARLVLSAGTLAAALTTLGGVMFAVGTIMKSTLVAGLIAALAPFLPLIAAVAALALAFETDFLGIRTAFQPFIDNLVNGFSYLGKAIKFFIQDIQDFGLEEAILGIFGKGTIADTMESTLEGVLVSFGMTRDAAIAFVDAVYGGFSQLMSVVVPVKEAFERFFGALQAGIPVGDAFKILLGDLSAIGNDVATRIRTAIENTDFVGVGEAIRTKLINALASIDPSALPPGMVEFINNIRGALIRELLILDVPQISINVQSFLLNAMNFDLDAAKKTVTDGINNAVTGIQQTDFSGVQTFFEKHFETIIRAALSVLAMVIGGPVGIGIGIVNLIITALENDFLGLRTKLEESGVGQSVRDALEGLRSTIENAFASVFGGGGGKADKAAAKAGEPVFAFGMSLSEIITKAFAGLKDIGDDVWEGLGNLLNGIKGFVAEVSKADLSGAGTVLNSLLAAIGGIVGKFLQVASSGFKGVTEGLERFLPDLGKVIADLLNLVTNIVDGDWNAAGDTVKSFLGNFVKALADIPAGFADGFLASVEGLLGIDLPSVEEGFNGLAHGLVDAAIAMNLVFDSIKRSFTRFFLEIQLEVQKYILGFRETIKEATGIDIAPEIRLDTQSTNFKLQAMDLADKLLSSFHTALASGGPVAFDESITWMMSPEGQEEIKAMGFDSAKMLTDALGWDAKRLLPQVLAQAFANNDMAALEVLIPIAAELGIPWEGLQAQIDTAVTGAAGAQIYTAEPAVVPTIQSPLPPISQQFQAIVNRAAAAQTFAATATSSVTVQAGSVNTAPFISTVTSFINQAIAGLRSLVSNPSGLASGIVGAIGSLSGLKDVGGQGVGGHSYRIGPSQADNEIFIPRSNGEFIPNFMSMMERMAAGGGQNTGDIYVQMPAEALANPAAAQTQGEIFGKAIQDILDGRGNT